MKLLYDLQLSFIDKASGKYMLDYDSNYNFARGVIKNLLQNHPEVEPMLLVPESDQAHPFTKLPIDQVSVRYNMNVIGSRFWDFAVLTRVEDIIRNIRPDVIWTNDMVRVPAYQLLAPPNTRIVCYNHWLDNRIKPKVALKQSYVFRQAEGAWKADAALFNSHFSGAFFLEGLKDYFIPDIISDIQKKLVKIPPLIDLEFLVNAEKSPTPTVMFNHRLSSLGYYSDNFKAFREIMDSVVQRVPNVKVLLTNPTGYLLEGLPEYMEMIPVNVYPEYLKILSTCWACVGIFPESYGNWSMSLGDAILAHTPVILPNDFGYKEMVPDFYRYKFDKIDEVEGMLIELLAQPDMHEHGRKAADEAWDFAVKEYSTTAKLPGLQEALYGH